MPEPTDLDLDLLVSAELDDELGALVTELGLDPAAVQHLLAGADAAARRSELASARTALGVPVPALDDTTRRRILRAAATAGASESRASRWPRIAAAAAVVAVLVVGTALLVARGGSDDAAKSGGGSASTASVPEGDLGNLGALDQQSVDALVGGPATPSSTDGAASKSRAPATGDAGTDAAPTLSAAVPEAVARCATEWAKKGTVRFQAAGTFGQQPAVIIGLAVGDRTIVTVVAADDCDTVLYSASR